MNFDLFATDGWQANKDHKQLGMLKVLDEKLFVTLQSQHNIWRTQVQENEKIFNVPLLSEQNIWRMQVRENEKSFGASLQSQQNIWRMNNKLFGVSLQSQQNIRIMHLQEKPELIWHYS